MDIETDSPSVAARYIAGQFKAGKGAVVGHPKGAEFFFGPAAHYRGGSGGMFVACTKGGCLILDAPYQVNRFRFVRARMTGWAASFCCDVLKELIDQTNNTHAETRNHIEG